MAALTLNSIRLCTLALGIALVVAPPALAGDVSVKLDAGTGFSVKNSTGAVERLRVDEATGNISRNGALFVHTTGVNNTFVGAGAGNLAPSGYGYNSAFGTYALHNNTYGSFDTAVGRSALRSNTTGGYNAAVGANTLDANTTGDGNSAVGFDVLGANTTASLNSAFGFEALRSNTTGPRNTAVGARALLYNTTGSGNSAVGYEALELNTTASFNSAFGFEALQSNTTGVRNSAVGVSALLYNTTGSGNSAVGYEALRLNTTASSNSAFGFKALRNSTGNGNTAVGERALTTNTTGYYNSAFGSLALLYNTTGHRNTAAGDEALLYNTTGFQNTADGYASLEFNTSASGNTAVGFAALRYSTGSGNTAIGANAGKYSTTGSSNIYINSVGVAGETNTTRIGPGAANQLRVFVDGIRGRTTDQANAIPVLIDNAGQLGTVSSSRNAKKDIQDMGAATERLLDLRPVMFRYKQEQTLPGGGEVPPEYGLIAEEVAEVFPDLVVYDEKGQPFTVKYHEMAPMLLNEMKKEHRANLEQQRMIEAQRQEIGALTTRLAQLETRVSGAPGEAQR